MAVERWVGRSQASITQPVKSHTSGSAALSGAAPAQGSGQARPSADQAQALGHRQQRRAGEQHPVAPQHAEGRRCQRG